MYKRVSPLAVSSNQSSSSYLVGAFNPSDILIEVTSTVVVPQLVSDLDLTHDKADHRRDSSIEALVL
jgi:hypothetical protein